MKSIRKHAHVIRIVAAILIVAMIAPVCVSASSIQPRASDYLSSYSAYVYRPGDGRAQVYFNVQGTGYMDELGVLRIYIYDSDDGGQTWVWRKTFTPENTSGLLSYNDDYHSGYVTYYGYSARLYKAYICVWGGKNGQGDTRYFWAYEQT